MRRPHATAADITHERDKFDLAVGSRHKLVDTHEILVRKLLCVSQRETECLLIVRDEIF